MTTFEPGGSDEHIAVLFQTMRRALALPLPKLAQRLATDPCILVALEAGALRDLPAAPEIRRIIAAYAALLDIDPAPILARLRQPCAPSAVKEQRALVPVPEQEPERARGRRPTARQLRRAATRILLAGVFLAVISLVWIAMSDPAMLRAMTQALPASVGRTVRAGVEMIVVLTAPQREGLRWIEVADPRSRKADKLDVTGR